MPENKYGSPVVARIDELNASEEARKRPRHQRRLTIHDAPEPEPTMPASGSPAVTGIARLVELEEERAVREKAKETSESWSALWSLMIFAGIVILVWVNWPTIKAWLLLNF